MVADRYGGVDILVNNLGYAENKGVFDVSLEEWNRVIDLTLTSTFLWTKHVGRVIADSGGGEIVNLASNLAHEAIPETAYCAAKGGVLNLTRELALDLAEYDIRVNSISPGLIGDTVGWTDPRDRASTSHVSLAAGSASRRTSATLLSTSYLTFPIPPLARTSVSMAA